ncbi:glycoside hydrolase family 15 protein [Paraconexibacter sp. AEG42_29]
MGGPGGSGAPVTAIADHGLIGDLHSAALIATDGTIAWFCPKRFDAPSVFARILDEDDGGCWTIAPTGDGARTAQFYFPDTNVLITRLMTQDGVVELQDLMPLRADDLDDEDPHHQRIVRRVVCVRGRMELTVRVAPRPDYGRSRYTLDPDADGRAVRFVGDGHGDGDGEPLLLCATVDLEVDGPDACATFTLEHGEAAGFVLHAGDPGDRHSGDHDRTDELFDTAVAAWRRWLSGSTYTGRWREMVHRSALALKLLTYVPTGAIVAAPTTSLPEELGGERNWDYRFVWIRDAAFTVYALLRLGLSDEAHAFVGWLDERLGEQDCTGRATERGPLQPMYRVDGDPDLPEAILDHLTGHAGSAPVRIGNGAADHLQLDIYGELIDSVYLYDKLGRPISHDTWTAVTELVGWLCEHWDQPDMGIWETRAGAQDHTVSRVMSWVAIERAVRMARSRGLPADLGRWTSVRDAIYAQVMDQGYDEERGAFVQRYGDDVLDAAVLLLPMVKFCAPTEPRFVSTLEAIEDELVADTLVHRYIADDSPDGLDGVEGTFSLCSFWYVEALTRVGRLDDAQLALEKMFTYANHLGLYAEQISPIGQQLGNFPQGLTHLSLISAAYNLDRALERS